MPPKFRKGDGENRDRVLLLGLGSSDEEEEEIFLNSSPNKPHQTSRSFNATVSRPQDQRIKKKYLENLIEGTMKGRSVQSQVSGVIDIMKTNIGKVIDRGEKLEDLEEKSEGLADSAVQFRHSSKRLAKKAWWQQCRMKLILAAIIAIILTIAIIIIVVRTRSRK